MKTINFIFLSTPRVDHSFDEKQQSISKETIYLSWLIWAMHQLGEFAFASLTIILCFSLSYLSPSFIGWIGLACHFACGIFQLRVIEARIPPSQNTAPWWRRVLVILSWPFHQMLFNFLKELDAIENIPDGIFDRDDVYGAFLFVVVSWGYAWMAIISLPMLVISILWDHFSLAG